MSEVQAGSSYLSQNDLRQHFGLGAHATIDQVEVAWPSGKKESFKNLPSDRIYTVVEGEGVTKEVKFASLLMTCPGTADEHYGLPTAFLFGLVPSVWETFWSVDDLATAL